MNYIGEAAAFATAICWTITGVSFELAGKKVGSFAVNLIRMLIALVVMTVFNYFTRGLAFPTDATSRAWFWLSISGLIGFVLGDLFLFQAYVLIGTRISMLIMATVPPITAILSFYIFNERLTLFGILGMLITITGIGMVIFVRGDSSQSLKLSHPIKGLSYAFIGAIGQAVGLITSKLGMGTYNAFAATQIRIIAGIVGFLILYTLTNRWNEAGSALKHRGAMIFIIIGSIFGPFLGVSLSLVSLQFTKAAIASTIMSILPVLVIPASILVFKEKVRLREIAGSALTVVGVAVLVLFQ